MYKLHVDRLCPSRSKSCYSYQVVSHQIYCSLCPIEKRIWSNKENLSYIYWLLQHLSCFTVTAQLTPNVSVYLQYIRVPFVFGEVDRHSNCFFLFILGHLIHLYYAHAKIHHKCKLLTNHRFSLYWIVHINKQFVALIRRFSFYSLSHWHHDLVPNM